MRKSTIRSIVIIAAFMLLGIHTQLQHNEINDMEAEIEHLNGQLASKTYEAQSYLELYSSAAAQRNKLEKELEASTRAMEMITDVDFEQICRVVAAESRGQSLLGQRLIAQCIYDRLEDGKFGDDVAEVLNRPGQFAYPWNGTLAECPSVVYAVYSVFIAKDMPTGSDILFFYNPTTANQKAVKSLEKHDLIMVEGAHVFRGRL